ncbi:hypothetical protein VP01_1891g1 [Puccinia sorghi]|uniref:Uncharacterized protein n=1 Tax=Puccinia sorghi TaxID=27349 RepID=A0A0L6VDI5_9BASI|nr:hypothetical protein VP01_1891g1 [Puccinia sorghi]
MRVSKMKEMIKDGEGLLLVRLMTFWVEAEPDIWRVKMHMKAHLRHKGFLKYILEVPVPLSEAAAEAVHKKHMETPKYSSSFKRFCILRNPEKPEPEKLLRQKKGQHGPYCAPGKHNPNPNPNAKNCVQSNSIIQYQYFKGRSYKTLLVPTLHQSLIFIPQLFKHELSISKTMDKGASVLIDIFFQLIGYLKNKCSEIKSSQFEVIKSNSACYPLCPNTPNWHLHLGHPNHKYPNLMVPNSELVDCSPCKACKLKILPFSGVELI